jgi:hypothetical protein
MTHDRQSNKPHSGEQPEPPQAEPQLGDTRRSCVQSVAWWSRAFFVALYPCRFAVLAVAIPGVTLLAVPQVQECVRALTERRLNHPLKIIQWAAVFAASLFWAASSWYWTRQLLSFRFPRQPPADRARRLAQQLLPRLIGTAALSVLALSTWWAGRGYGPVDDGRVVLELDHVALAMLGMAIAFYLFVHFRRRVFRLPPVMVIARLRDLPLSTKIALAVTTAITVMFFVGFAWAPLTIAPKLGSVAILLIAAAAWCAFGSMAVYADRRYGVPVLPLAVVAVLVFSFWNDNHALRGTGTVAPEPMSIEAYADAWLDARRGQFGPQPYPVLIVAAAGGGIRAAYWTGSLLAALQDRYGQAFSDHTFAIRGVSGGSLGAATYVVLLDERLKSGRNPRCREDPAATLQACARAVLGQDFLAPVVGSMLFPDLAQRFWPWSVPQFDRARVLETAWERAWTAQGLPNALSQRFYGLWSRPEMAVHRPLLFLNSTLVESGERVIVSPVLLPPETEFFGALALRTLTPADLPLSSAVHLSARFTYISPAASIYGANGHLIAHLVDGSYFESSGADTAAGLVNAIRSAARKRSPAAALDIHVLLISNAPGEKVGMPPPRPSPERWITEFRAPIAALLNARNARGWEAESTVERLVRADGGALTMGLLSTRIDLPLGWTLSDAAQCEIDRQLANALSDNKRPPAIVALDSLLAERKTSVTPVETNTPRRSPLTAACR